MEGIYRLGPLRISNRLLSPKKKQKPRNFGLFPLLEIRSLLLVSIYCINLHQLTDMIHHIGAVIVDGHSLLL